MKSGDKYATFLNLDNANIIWTDIELDIQCELIFDLGLYMKDESFVWTAGEGCDLPGGQVSYAVDEQGIMDGMYGPDGEFYEIVYSMDDEEDATI